MSMSHFAARRVLMRSGLRAKLLGISSTRVVVPPVMRNIFVAHAQHRGFMVSARLASPGAKAAPKPKPKPKKTVAKAKTVVKKRVTAKATTKKAAPKRKVAAKTAAKKKAAPKKKVAVKKAEPKASTPRNDPALRPPPRRVSALTMFVKRMYPTLQPKPTSATTGLLQLTSMWRGMTDAEKKPYEDEAATEAVKRRAAYEKWRAGLTLGEVRAINEYRTSGKAPHQKLGRPTDSAKKPANGFIKFYAETMKAGKIDATKAPAGVRPVVFATKEAAKLWKGMTEAQKAAYKA